MQAALRAVFRLLPVRTREAELEGEGEGEAVRRALPENFAAIALNGFFFPPAGRILGAGLLLTWFLSDLSASAFLVGLIVPIQYGLALLAQPAIAQWLSTKPRHAPYYARQSWLRGLLWCALGAGASLIGRQHSVWLIILFFAVITADAVAAGVGNIAFNDTLARVIPKRLRGQVRSWRGIFGSLMAAAAALLIHSYFSDRSGVSAFAWLFAIAGVLYAIGGSIFLLLDEPAERRASRRPRLAEVLPRIRELLRNRPFRRFVIVQSLLVPLTQALPFFTLFGRRVFHLETETLGLLILSDAAAPVIGNFIWGKLADAKSNRFVIAAAAICGLAAPICAGLLQLLGGSRWAVILLFAAIVFVVGAASVGVDLATKNYVLELAPDASQRPLYIGINDALVALPTMLLAGAGVVIDLAGFAPVFLGLALCAAAAAVLAVRLRSEQRARNRED
jgi:MFS family permease